MDNQRAIKDYNIWSNFTYFISAIYALIIPFITLNMSKGYKALFIASGILIALDGSISCIYHQFTPSYKENKDQSKEEEYKILCDLDRYLAIMSAVLSAIIFLMRIYAGKFWVIVKDPTFYIMILFIAIGFVFYFMARKYDDELETCKNKKCIVYHMDSYDILHSNWHLFTGISILFGLTTLKHTFERA